MCSLYLDLVISKKDGDPSPGQSKILHSTGVLVNAQVVYCEVLIMIAVPALGATSHIVSFHNQVTSDGSEWTGSGNHTFLGNQVANFLTRPCGAHFRRV